MLSYGQMSPGQMLPGQMSPFQLESALYIFPGTSTFKVWSKSGQLQFRYLVGVVVNLLLLVTGVKQSLLQV